GGGRGRPKRIFRRPGYEPSSLPRCDTPLPMNFAPSTYTKKFRESDWGYANGTLEALNASFIFVVYALTSFPFTALSG
ncbi:hypothetical protein BDM02DRAFT_3124686, partial [Thelephora ganbajun]